MFVKGVPKNFGYVVTVTTLGLVLLSILIFVYSIYFSDRAVVENAQSSDSVGVRDGGTEEYDMGVDKGIAPYYPLPSETVANNETEQKLVKRAELDVTVEDFDDTSDKVRGAVKELGGFVVSSNDSGVSLERTVVMTVKVPSSSFDTFVTQVKEFATVVNSYNENTSDVTMVYQDLQARLRNEKALEAKLVEILEIATKVSEVLEVQKELSQVTQNIETLESQIKYYDAQIEMSSVTIEMSLSSDSLDVVGDRWQPVGVFKEALASLVGLGKNLGTLAIWMVVFSPVLAAMYYAFKWVSNRITIK